MEDIITDTAGSTTPPGLRDGVLTVVAVAGFLLLPTYFTERGTLGIHIP